MIPSNIRPNLRCSKDHSKQEPLKPLPCIKLSTKDKARQEKKNAVLREHAFQPAVAEEKEIIKRSSAV
jgi:hypothetical protein